MCLGALLPSSAAAAPQWSGGSGVSLAGPEFGGHDEAFSNLNPGKQNIDYVFPQEETIAFFASHGADFIRLPFRWERIQSQPGGALDSAYLKAIRKVCDGARRHNIGVVLDLHNYGRYRFQSKKQVFEIVIDEVIDGKAPVSRDHFADLWSRLATQLRRHPAVIGYGLMNEPHDMGDSNWKKMSQTAVDSIRKVDRTTTILVGGDQWSSAAKFESVNGSKAWIHDPSDKTVYEAHLYFDADASGKYVRSYAKEKRLDPKIAQRAQQRLTPFLNWCQKNKVRGIIGECGCPSDRQWKPLLQHIVTACLQEGHSVCYWAAGPWWDKHPLSVEPQANVQMPQWVWLIDAKNEIQKTKIQKKLSGSQFTNKPSSRLVTELFDKP